MIDPLAVESRLGQTRFNGPMGKRRIMFPTRKPFLLGGRDESPIDYQRSGRIMVERGNTEDGSHEVKSSAIVPS